MSSARVRRSTPQQILNKALQWDGFYQKKYGHSFEVALKSARSWHPWATDEMIEEALVFNGVTRDANQPIPGACGTHPEPNPIPPPGAEAGAGDSAPSGRSSNARLRRSRR